MAVRDLYNVVLAKSTPSPRWLQLSHSKVVCEIGRKRTTIVRVRLGGENAAAMNLAAKLKSVRLLSNPDRRRAGERRAAWGWRMGDGTGRDGEGGGGRLLIRAPQEDVMQFGNRRTPA